MAQEVFQTQLTQVADDGSEVIVYPINSKKEVITGEIPVSQEALEMPASYPEERLEETISKIKLYLQNLSNIASIARNVVDNPSDNTNNLASTKATAALKLDIDNLNDALKQAQEDINSNSKSLDLLITEKCNEIKSHVSDLLTKNNGIAPNNMTSFHAYQNGDYVAISFTEPSDTVIENQTLSMVAGVKIIKKDTGFPNTPAAGIELLDIKREEFGKYASSGFLDKNVSVGKKYYYAAFPYNYNGIYNLNPVNRSSVEVTDLGIYGYDVNMSDSNPETRVSYPTDVTNHSYTPVTVDKSSGDYSMGSWSGCSLIKKIRPVMLKYDGTVDYELDHSNQNYKLDGTASDISNASYGGNAMVEFPKMYFKRWESDGMQHVRIAAKKVDSTYHCYQHMYNGKELETIYLPMYEGSVVSSKLRSLAGQTPESSNSGSTELNYITANGDGWQFDDWMNTIMVQHLLFMVGKSTDLQATFGNGNCNSKSKLTTGTTKAKGMFYGKSTKTEAVKVFWLENYYADRYDRKFGCIYYNGKIFIQPYPPYSTTKSSGTFIDTGISCGSIRGYVSKTKMTEYGEFPIEASGTSSTYIPDYCYYDNSGEYFLFWGGRYNYALHAGASVYLSYTFSDSHSNRGASLSYKSPKAA